jgi:Xaa-Pro aminopeptidase
LFRRANAGHAFDPIIAAGARACVLHLDNLAGRLQSGELLQFDIGAEVAGYAADISRSYVIGGAASPRQQAIHAAVVEVQAYALSLLKPGVLLRAYEQEVTAFMGEKLRELSLIKTISPDEVRRFFPHATSHFLGLDVHDVGPYDRPLEPGMVLTCEPGIYIHSEGLGVRIEDDVLITETGNTVLSSGLSLGIA